MSLPLIVNPEAEADLAEARDWYDGQRAGLGDRLLAHVEEVFTHLQQTPELYAKVFQDLRLARVRRFPYYVVYRIDEDQITVVAVYHTSRDPRGWRNRTEPFTGPDVRRNTLGQHPLAVVPPGAQVSKIRATATWKPGR